MGNDIYAFTEPTGGEPDFINVSADESISNGGGKGIRVTIRDKGQVSAISLTPEQAKLLRHALTRYQIETNDA